MTEIPASQGAQVLRHVETRCCRYVSDPRTTDDVKLVDQRCVAAYLVPGEIES